MRDFSSIWRARLIVPLGIAAFGGGAIHWAGHPPGFHAAIPHNNALEVAISEDMGIANSLVPVQERAPSNPSLTELRIGKSGPLSAPQRAALPARLPVRSAAWIERKVLANTADPRKAKVFGCGNNLASDRRDVKREEPTTPQLEPSTEQEWLLAQQTEAGFWETNPLRFEGGHGGSAAGAWDQDLAVTSLASLFLIAEGERQQPLRRAIRWIVKQQDATTGFIGDPTLHVALRQHALATLALLESVRYSRNPLHKRAAEKALAALEHGLQQFPWPFHASAWQAEHTSMAAWSLLARKATPKAGLRVTPCESNQACVWARFWRDRWKAAEAAGDPVECRSLAESPAFPLIGLAFALDGESPPPGWQEFLGQHAAVARMAPASETTYFLTLGAHHGQPEVMQAWREAIQTSNLAAFRPAGSLRGSWNPAAPDSQSGGRVGATALAGMIQASLYRYSRLAGMR